MSTYKIAIFNWPAAGDGIGKAVSEELGRLGHHTLFFDPHHVLPEDVDVVWFYGPYGKYLDSLASIIDRFNSPPVTVLWNTEGLPDLRIPWPVTEVVSRWRSWVGRFADSVEATSAPLGSRSLLGFIDGRMTRFRYLGDYLYARRMGWLDVYADISSVYSQFLSKRNLSGIVAHFGSFSDWYADLKLARDIDVVWMGKRASGRRSHMLDTVREQLARYGVDLYVVDGEERPYVFDEERTRLLNRSKITLNLLRTWYDENSLRMCFAMPNRSLVVSEPLLAHVPLYKAGEHYVAAPPEQLAETILHYLEHEDERQRIVENAYQLSTQKLTMQHAVVSILEAVDKVCAARRDAELN